MTRETVGEFEKEFKRIHKMIMKSEKKFEAFTREGNDFYIPVSKKIKGNYYLDEGLHK